MRYSVKNILKVAIGLAAVTGFALSPASAAEKKDFKVAWSIYVGWMPWGY
ncbi:MAG TPA: lipid kinase, partial [Hyphomicrobium sp.]